MAGRAIGFLAALYVGSLVALLAVGVVPVLPGQFVVFIVLVALPLGYGIAHGIFLAETRWRQAFGGRVAFLIVLGLLLLAVFRPRNLVVHLVGWTLLATAVWHLGRADAEVRRRLGASVIVLTLGYGTVWNLKLTGELMRAMALEYVAVTTGGAVNGYGYFVGLPSLHVAMAVLLQGALSPRRGPFWLLLPVNSLLVLSTVLLGYHYLVDAPAGALLGLLVLAPGWLGARRGAGARRPAGRALSSVESPG